MENIDRTFADAIKVTLPNGYKQKFWVDLTDQEAIKKCEFMQEIGVSSF